MSNRILDDKAIKNVVQDIFEEAIRRNIELPSCMVLVGGSAMAFNGLRLSSDVDMYVSEEGQAALLGIVSDLMPKWTERFDDDFAIDITTNDYVFSKTIRIADIQQASKLGFAKIGDDTYGYGILDAETIFIAKCCSGREKDIEDLSLIMEHSSVDKIIERLNEMIKFNNRFNGREATELVLASLRMETMTLVNKDWIKKLTNMDSQERSEIYRIFGVEEETIDHPIVSVSSPKI